MSGNASKPIEQQKLSFISIRTTKERKAFIKSHLKAGETISSFFWDLAIPELKKRSNLKD